MEYALLLSSFYRKGNWGSGYSIACSRSHDKWVMRPGLNPGTWFQSMYIMLLSQLSCYFWQWRLGSQQPSWTYSVHIHIQIIIFSFSWMTLENFFSLPKSQTAKFHLFLKTCSNPASFMMSLTIIPNCDLVFRNLTKFHIFNHLFTLSFAAV